MAKGPIGYRTCVWCGELKLIENNFPGETRICFACRGDKPVLQRATNNKPPGPWPPQYSGKETNTIKAIHLLRESKSPEQIKAQRILDAMRLTG